MRISDWSSDVCSSDLTGLIKKDGTIRIDPGGNKCGGHFPDVADALLTRFMHGDAVQIGEEKEALTAFVHFVLHPHPIPDRAQIIAQMEIAGRLNAGTDAHVLKSFLTLQYGTTVDRKSPRLNSSH